MERNEEGYSEESAGTALTDRLDALVKEETVLAGEVEHLKKENEELALRLEELEREVSYKRLEAKEAVEQLKEEKARHLEPLVKENTLRSEIYLLEKEWEVLGLEFNESSLLLGGEMETLGGIIKEMEYTRAEIMHLKERGEYLESELPFKSRDLELMDEKFLGTGRALGDLYDRLKEARKNMKVLYYTKERS